MICDQCGKDKPDVKERLDPYEEDVNNREVLRNLCRNCEYEIAQDI